MSADQPWDVGEQAYRDLNLGKLEDDVEPVTDDICADLEQLFS